MIRRTVFCLIFLPCAALILAVAWVSLVVAGVCWLATGSAGQDDAVLMNPVLGWVVELPFRLLKEDK